MVVRVEPSMLATMFNKLKIYNSMKSSRIDSISLWTAVGKWLAQDKAKAKDEDKFDYFNAKNKIQITKNYQKNSFD